MGVPCGGGLHGTSSGLHPALLAETYSFDATGVHIFDFDYKFTSE